MFRGQDVPVKLAWMCGEIAKLCLLNALFEHRIRGKAFGFQPLPNGVKRLRTLLAATPEIPACGPPDTRDLFRIPRRNLK
jgi:hypothetical protein